MSAAAPRAAWVDGRFVGGREGGHTPFTFEITDALEGPGEHEIAVWAHDDPQGLAQPRGKQDWKDEPHSIWYPVRPASGRRCGSRRCPAAA